MSGRAEELRLHRGHGASFPGHHKSRFQPALLLLLAACLGLTGCIRGQYDGFEPPRPYFDYGLGEVPAHPPEPFPERRIFEPRDETPPQTLARIEELFRPIATLKRTEPDWRREELKTEIDSIRSDLDDLDIGTGALFRERLGTLRENDREKFGRASALYVRWGFALLRSGELNERVWAGEKFRQAQQWDPDNPILVLILAAYYELGGFWSNELDLLDGYIRSNGESDLINLQRLRKRERSWKVSRIRDDLDQALSLCASMAMAKGGWEEGPAWLNLERARLLLLADSTRSAEKSALLARSQLGTPPSDTLTCAQVELLLGVASTRRLEYTQATAHLERAQRLAASRPSLVGLASWMSIPWDLWTKEEQERYDRSRNHRAFVEEFWAANDPIWATPRLLENRTEYWRRMGEAWFRLSGIDPASPGPLTPAGEVLLRFGMPLEWTSRAGQTTPGAAQGAGLTYAVNRSWRLRYRFQGPMGMRNATVHLQDRGSGSRFSPVDSLRGPLWPPHVFSYDFEGRSYRLDTSLSRFRQPDGRTRLLIVHDTYLPNYSVRFPLQGLRFEGEARVQTALYRNLSRRWSPVAETETILESETVLPREWEFRRRAGIVDIRDLMPGVIRVASMLTLRDQEERVVGVAVDNGEDGQLQDFGWDELEASDLLLLNDFAEEIPMDGERLLKPGLVVYGPDLVAEDLQPRAGRFYLQGESLSFYLEVYNLDTRTGVTEVELQTALERLQPDGRPEYTVSIRGLAQTLVRFGVNQWNVARSLGLGDLEPGRYRLRVAFFDRKASRRVERFAEFRLVSTREVVDLYRWAELELPQ